MHITLTLVYPTHHGTWQCDLKLCKSYLNKSFMFMKDLVPHMISGSWIRWSCVTLNSWICMFMIVEPMKLESIWNVVRKALCFVYTSANTAQCKSTRCVLTLFVIQNINPIWPCNSDVYAKVFVQVHHTNAEVYSDKINCYLFLQILREKSSHVQMKPHHLEELAESQCLSFPWLWEYTFLGVSGRVVKLPISVALSLRKLYKVGV